MDQPPPAEDTALSVHPRLTAFTVISVVPPQGGEDGVDGISVPAPPPPGPPCPATSTLHPMPQAEHVALLEQRTKECDGLREDRNLLEQERDELAREWEALHHAQELVVDNATQAQEEAEQQIEALQRALAQSQRTSEDKALAAEKLQGTLENLRGAMDISTGLHEGFCTAVRALAADARAVRDQLLAAVAAQGEALEALVRDVGGAAAERPESPEPVARAAPPVPYLHPALEPHAAVLTDLQELLPRLRDVRVCAEIRNGLAAWETAWQALQLQLQELEGRRQVENGVDAQWQQALLELKDQRLCDAMKLMTAKMEGLQEEVCAAEVTNGQMLCREQQVYVFRLR